MQHSRSRRTAPFGLLGALLLIVSVPAAFTAVARLANGASPGGQAGAQAEVDILITGGTVITMDPDRRVLEDGAVAIAGDRIRAVGTSRDIRAAFRGRREIDARRKVVMPGLIDGHGHAGHGLLKSLGTDIPDAWYKACERIYAEGSTEAFWRADALLSSLERLKFGVTTGVTFFGGGESIMRTDDVRYGNAALGGVQQVGVRWVLAVGTAPGPLSEQIRELGERHAAGRGGDVRGPSRDERGADQAVARPGEREDLDRDDVPDAPPGIVNALRRGGIRADRARPRGARPVEEVRPALHAGWAQPRLGEVRRRAASTSSGPTCCCRTRQASRTRRSRFAAAPTRASPTTPARSRRSGPGAPQPS